MSLFDQLKVQIENNVPLPSVSDTPKRGRGRPKGSTNKLKLPIDVTTDRISSTHENISNKPKDAPVPVLDTKKIEQETLKCYRTGKRGRPKKEKEPVYTIVGTLNKAAVEWEAPPENPEEIEKDKVRRSRNQDWKRFCARGYCGHTAIAHSTDGKGRCWIENCKCGEFL
jgi:hypothetical protein